MSEVKRRIILDTETTGMPAVDGHRIIEIGCVEMLDRELTGNHYHQYINPEREVDLGAYEVHGIGDEFLSDKPIMSQCVDEFIDFIRGAELIIHNATFDVGFIDHEFALLGREERVANICTVTDTLVMARKKHPGARASLDALTKRYGINSFNRELHGALLDSEILAQVYLAMTGGQSGLAFAEQKPKSQSFGGVTDSNQYANIAVVEVPLSEEEIAAHQQLLGG